MLSEGAFWASVRKCQTLLNELEFLQDVNNKRGNYSQSFFHNKDLEDYIKIYDSNLENYDFELLLNDNSHFQFRHEANAISMAFFPRPNEFLNYEEFIYEIFKDQIAELSKYEAQEFLNEVLSGDNQGEYDQYLLELDNSKNVIPIRLDYDLDNYCKLYHPLCHLHIGTNNNIRIAVDKLATPYLFLLFVLKNYFPDLFFIIDSTGKKVVRNSIKFEDKKLSIPIKNPFFEDEHNIIHMS